MKKTKPSVKYKTVSLAEPLMMDIIKYVENSNRYRSVADFVRQSVRSQLQYEDGNIESDFSRQTMQKQMLDGKNTSIRDIVREEMRNYLKNLP